MQIKKLKEIATITMWQSPSSETYNTEGIWLPFFQWKKEFWEKYPTVEKYCSAPIKVAESWDILMSVRAPVWPTNVANCKCCIGRWLCAIRIDENVWNQSYLLLFFKSFEHNILALRKGSTFDAIWKTDLENLQIPLPPLSTQKAIVAKLDTTFASLDQAITSTQKNLNHLDELKKSILNDTFNINNIYIYISRIVR
jgi:type I restriction enzyme S subunit